MSSNRFAPLQQLGLIFALGGLGILPIGCDSQSTRAPSSENTSAKIPEPDRSADSQTEKAISRGIKEGEWDTIQPIRKTRTVPAVDGPPLLRSDSTLSNTPQAPSPTVSTSLPATIPTGDPRRKLTVASHGVDVFFATDRLPTSQIIPGTFRTFLPAFAVFSACIAMFIGLVSAKRFQMFWLMGSSLAICMGITTLHTCIVRAQQYSQLSSNAGTRFSNARFESNDSEYPLYVGNAEVRLSTFDEGNHLDSPSVIRVDFTEDLEKHTSVRSLAVDSSEDWFHQISRRAKFAEEREGLVFVHGYNVRFATALKRTALLAADLDMDGPVICFSWPSRGKPTAYEFDESAISWSAPHLEQLLIDLRGRTDCRRLTLVAEGLGNRALLKSIERISQRLSQENQSQTEPKLVESLILAAPDIDAQDFSSRYVPVIDRVAKHATVYFSNQDLVQHLRLADDHAAWTRLSPNIDAIQFERQNPNASNLGYGIRVPMLREDIRENLAVGKPASERKYLRRLTNGNGYPYWKFDSRLHAKLSKVHQR